MIRNDQERKKIIPVCSGKGGVGCSTIATNIAIGLASHGRKVLLVDLDIGRGDCRTLLDVSTNEYSVVTLLTDKNIEQSNYCHPTSYRNLYLLPSSTRVPIQHPSIPKQFKVIFKAVASFSFDYIIFDVPTGLSPLSKHLFFTVNSGIIVTTCDSNAIQCQLHFGIEALCWHCLNSARIVRSKDVQAYFEEVYDGLHMHSFGKHLVELEKIDSTFTSRLREELHSAKPFIIANQLRSSKELNAVSDLMGRFHDELGIQFDVLGAIYANDLISVDMNSHTPTMASTMDSQPFQQLNRVCQKILLSPDYPILPLDYENYDNGLELAQIEIENDGPMSAELSHDRYQVSHYQSNTDQQMSVPQDIS